MNACSWPSNPYSSTTTKYATFTGSLSFIGTLQLDYLYSTFYSVPAWSWNGSTPLLGGCEPFWTTNITFVELRMNPFSCSFVLQVGGTRTNSFNSMFQSGSVVPSSYYPFLGTFALNGNQLMQPCLAPLFYPSPGATVTD